MVENKDPFLLTPPESGITQSSAPDLVDFNRGVTKWKAGLILFTPQIVFEVDDSIQCYIK